MLCVSELIPRNLAGAVGENAMKPDKVGWMLSFWHSKGDWRGEVDFPDVEFWQPDRKTARVEAASALTELRARGDMRDWVAAGHPDPREVAVGNHHGGQWVLRYADLECASAENGTRLSQEAVDVGMAGKCIVGTRSAADDWIGVDWEKMKRDLHEARHSGTRR